MPQKAARLLKDLVTDCHVSLPFILFSCSKLFHLQQRSLDLHGDHAGIFLTSAVQTAKASQHNSASPHKPLGTILPWGNITATGLFPARSFPRRFFPAA